MAKYIVNVKMVFSQNVEVEADSHEEAIEGILDGEIEYNPVGDQEFEGYCPKDTFTVETAEPRFDQTYCSQCGKELGPGDSGVSHCEHHD